MIKLILFDLGGVIYTSNRNESVKRFAALGLKNADSRLSAYTQTGIFGDLEEGKITDIEFLEALEKDTGKEISWNDCRHAWLGYAADLPERNIKLLETLCKQGYRLALASNTNEFMMSWTCSNEFDGKGNSIKHYMDELYVSYKIGALKPSRRFFEFILDKENVKPEETLFIDDGPKNVEAAKSIGVNTIQAINGEDWTKDVLYVCAHTNI
jgi:HAD superfamily hydrolase (TIGR01509 family)